jgi:hypothetical protein
MQDWCTICVERTIGSKSFWTHPWYTLVTWVMPNLSSFYFEIVFVSVQDRCMVYARCTIGSKIVLDAPNENPR